MRTNKEIHNLLVSYNLMSKFAKFMGVSRTWLYVMLDRDKSLSDDYNEFIKGLK